MVENTVYLIHAQSFCPYLGTKTSKGYGEPGSGKVYQNTCGGALDPLELKLLENITVWAILVCQIYRDVGRSGLAGGLAGRRAFRKFRQTPDLGRPRQFAKFGRENLRNGGQI